MTVASGAYKSSRTWTGVETSFNPGIAAQSVADILLSFDDGAGVVSPLTNGVHLALSKAGAVGENGAITATPLPGMVPAPGTVIFERSTPDVQPINFNDLAKYTADVHTKLHDHHVNRAAELAGEFDVRIEIAVGDAEAAADAAAASADTATTAADIAVDAKDAALAAQAAAEAAKNGAQAAQAAATAKAAEAAVSAASAANDAALAGMASENPGFTYKWKDDITGTDPLPGYVKGNNLALGAITALAISKVALEGNLAGYLASRLGSTSTSVKATLAIKKPQSGDYFTAAVSSIVDGGTFYTLGVINLNVLGDFATDDIMTVFIERTGDAGMGAGDVMAANNLSDLASQKTGFDNLSKHGADVVAAASINLDTATGVLIDVTGNTGIGAIILADGRERVVRFTGTPILTPSGTFILPGDLPMQVAAGDFAIFRGYASNLVRCVDYIRKDGHSLPVSTANVASAATTDLGSTLAQNIGITGSVTITSFGNTAPSGAVKCLTFVAAPLLTHSAALVLPGAANIQIAGGDGLIVKHDGAGNWRVLSFLRGAGRPVNTGVSDKLSKGFTGAVFDIGNSGAGPVTPLSDNGQFQKYSNTAAHTLAPPVMTDGTSIHLTITNSATAGAIATAGFTKVTGDPFTTVNGNIFMCWITKSGATSHLHVQAMQ